MTPGIDQFVLVARALGDANRLKALAALAHGELCLCQIIDLLEVAPSTASRHMAILAEAGLVSVRCKGRWHYYRRAGADASAVVRDALEWVRRSIAACDCQCVDPSRLRAVLEADPQELTCCYRPTGSRPVRAKARA